MSVTAKFKVQRITPQSPIVRDGVKYDAAEVELIPDYAGDRNKEWSIYTPSGVIRMNINSPALQQYEVGKAFTVTFEAEDE